MLQAGPPSLHYYCAPSCCIPAAYYHMSATLQTMSITVVNLQDIRAVFRIFIALLRFSFDSPSYLYSKFQCLSQWPRGLRRGCAPARFLGLWLEFLRRHGYLSLASVVCCQVEVSATGLSFVQRNPTECVCVCVSLSVIECNNNPPYLQ